MGIILAIIGVVLFLFWLIIKVTIQSILLSRFRKKVASYLPIDWDDYSLEDSLYDALGGEMDAIWNID